MFVFHQIHGCSSKIKGGRGFSSGFAKGTTIPEKGYRKRGCFGSGTQLLRELIARYNRIMIKIERKTMRNSNSI